MKCDVHGVEGCKSTGCAIWVGCTCGDDSHHGTRQHREHVLSGIVGDAGYCCKCSKEVVLHGGRNEESKISKKSGKTDQRPTRR